MYDGYSSLSLDLSVCLFVTKLNLPVGSLLNSKEFQLMDFAKKLFSPEL